MFELYSETDYQEMAQARRVLNKMTMDNVKRRLEVQVIDKIEQQVQYCLRSYANDLLEDKLIALVQEWFFKGFFGGTEHAQLQHEQKG